MGLRVEGIDGVIQKLSHIGRMATGEQWNGTPLDFLEISRQHLRKEVVSMFRVLAKGARPKLQRRWREKIGQHRGQVWMDYRAKHHRKTTGQKPAAWGGAARMKEFGYAGNIIGRPRGKVGTGTWKEGKYSPASMATRIRKNTPMGGGERGSIAVNWGKKGRRPRKGRGSRTLFMGPSKGTAKKAAYFNRGHPFAFVLKKDVESLRLRLQRAMNQRIKAARID